MYIIRNAATQTVTYLSRLQLFTDGRKTGHVMHWTKHSLLALQFEEQEEAQAVIDFIGNVLDWELAEALEVEYIV